MPAGERTVTTEIRIDARPEAVFPFLTEPDKIVRWKGVDARVEAAPGGVYRVQVTPRNLAVGEYVVVDPPRRVVFTWGWEGDDQLPPGSSTVEIELVPDGDGTIVRLTHSGLPDGAEVGQLEGWQHFLPRLASVAAGGDPGPDPWAEEGGM
jgi:uncharacterized protein YndB with AHSA1/START domain